MAGGIGMMQVQVADEGSWRTQNFRQNMVAKIDEAILHCGAPTTKSATEMENQVYSKANSKNEYLSFVARLILHIKEMGNKNKGTGQLPPTNQATAMANQVSQLNSMSHNMGQLQGGQQQQQGQQQMGGGQPQPMTVGMLQQQAAGINIGNNAGVMAPQQVRSGPPTHTSMHLNPIQVINPNFVNAHMAQQRQQEQQLQMQQQRQQEQEQQRLAMQGSGGGGGMNPQTLQRLQQAQIQQVLLHQQQKREQQQEQQQQQGDQQQSGIGRGMRLPSSMTMNLPQRKTMQHRPMNPTAMGLSRPDHGANYPMNRLIYFGSQQADGVGGGMTNQFQGGGGVGGGASGPFLPPNASPGMSLGGPAPSPNSMVQGSNQSGFVNSPQPPHPHGSPAPPQSGGIRPFGSKSPYQMVPSPSMNLNVNTPLPMVPTPSPRNPEELACMKKIEELRRYTDMIQRMIIKIGNEDAEKSSKMKKLLDILMNPTRQVSMDLLLKCEAALKKMEKQQHETGPASQPTMPPKDQISPFLQIQEALLTTLKNGSASHTFLRTFRPSIEALTGQSAIASDIPDDDESAMRKEEPQPLIPPILQRELKMLGRRFPVKIRPRGRKLPIQLNVSLGDPKLPKVPLLKIIVPLDYPDESPILIDFRKDYSSTTFLNSVSQAFKSRKVLLPTKFTVYELLISWEMSVRQVSNPISPRKVTTLKSITSGLAKGRLPRYYESPKKQKN